MNGKELSSSRTAGKPQRNDDPNPPEDGARNLQTRSRASSHCWFEAAPHISCFLSLVPAGELFCFPVIPMFYKHCLAHHPKPAAIPFPAGNIMKKNESPFGTAVTFRDNLGKIWPLLKCHPVLWSCSQLPAWKKPTWKKKNQKTKHLQDIKHLQLL